MQGFDKNFWQIIKIKISRHQQRIHSLEEMKKAIKEKWNKISEEDFQKCIETIHRRCELLTLARCSFRY